MTLRRPAAAGHPADFAVAAPAMTTKSLESRALLLARELHLPWRKPTAGTKAMIPSLIEDVNIESLIRQENLPQICSTADRLRRHAQAAPESFDASSLQLLDALLTAAAEAEQTLALQRARIRYLESLSVTDEMTGLLNRRGFGLELSRALARARRQNESGLLVMFDLDNFKAINDTYGHPAGAAILRPVGKALTPNTPETGRTSGRERVCQYG